MFPPLLITLRETLEASLVVGIVLALLQHTQNQKYNYFAWAGVFLGVALSILLAWVFTRFVGGFSGQTEYLYEGVTMLSAACLTTWMVIWMDSQSKNMRQGIEAKVTTHLERNSLIGLLLLTFVSVAREGIETILMLHAAFLHTGSSNQHIGATLGICIAIGMSVAFFKSMNGVSLKAFFKVTTVLLLLFSAGLVAHGIHELQEAGVIPIIIEHVWDLNPLLNEKGIVGGLLKSLFGYNGNPSLIEILSYGVYMCMMGGWLVYRSTKNN